MNNDVLKELCGCGKAARYYTIRGEFACNKYVRCSDPPKKNIMDERIKNTANQILANIFSSDHIIPEGNKLTYWSMQDSWNELPLEVRNIIMESIEVELERGCYGL
jgi:hypothetical protein